MLVLNFVLQPYYDALICKACVNYQLHGLGLTRSIIPPPRDYKSKDAQIDEHLQNSQINRKRVVPSNQNSLCLTHSNPLTTLKSDFTKRKKIISTHHLNQSNCLLIQTPCVFHFKLITLANCKLARHLFIQLLGNSQVSPKLWCFGTSQTTANVLLFSHFLLSHEK